MDENMMREALLLAQEAAAEGEVPVGCVITLDDRIVGRGIAMGLLSIPEKYMHTPVEVVELSDVQAVADLMAEFLREFDGEVGA